IGIEVIEIDDSCQMMIHAAGVTRRGNKLRRQFLLHLKGVNVGLGIWGVSFGAPDCDFVRPIRNARRIQANGQFRVSRKAERRAARSHRLKDLASYKSIIRSAAADAVTGYIRRISVGITK